MSRRKLFSVLLGSVFLGCSFHFAGVALSQDADEQLWLQLDWNRDGRLDGRKLGKDLSRLDRNRDGAISLDEYLASPNDAQLEIAPPPTHPERTSKSKILKRVLFQSGNAQPVGAESRNSQPVLGKMVAGRPVGFFYMQKYWMATRKLENSCWYFASDGRVYQNLTTGFSEKDLKEHKGPQGTFEVNGGKLNIVWSDGKSSTAEIELTETGFYWDTGSYLPIEPFAGKSLSGEYSGGSSSTFSGTSAMVAKTLRLNDDGSFTMSGVTSFRTEEDSSRGTKSQSLAGGSSDIAGRWKQDGFYLTLTADSGESQRQVIFPFDDNTTVVYPDRLYMAGVMYKKR